LEETDPWAPLLSLRAKFSQSPLNISSPSKTSASDLGTSPSPKALERRFPQLGCGGLGAPDGLSPSQLQHRCHVPDQLVSREGLGGALAVWSPVLPAASLCASLRAAVAASAAAGLPLALSLASQPPPPGGGDRVSREAQRQCPAWLRLPCQAAVPLASLWGDTAIRVGAGPRRAGGGADSAVPGPRA
jgi:hypothetical protein